MDQKTLEGDTVPVQRDEKTTTTITWKSNYFKISLKQKDYENLVTGATGEDSESFIMKRMKMHRGFPVSNAGKVFKEELKKLKTAIMEGIEEAEQTENFEHHEEEPGSEEKGKDQTEPFADDQTSSQSPDETAQPGSPEPSEEENMTVLVTNLITEERDEALEDYLVNNFKPAVIFKLAEKLHIKVKKNELPQKTAFNIAVKIKALKEKPNATR